MLTLPSIGDVMLTTHMQYATYVEKAHFAKRYVVTLIDSKWHFLQGPDSWASLCLEGPPTEEVLTPALALTCLVALHPWSCCSWCTVY